MPFKHHFVGGRGEDLVGCDFVPASPQLLGGKLVSEHGQTTARCFPFYLVLDDVPVLGQFIIGRQTAFTYKGKAIDLKQVGRELNVRNVLEGSLQRNGNRLRVNVQLVDAETANHLWAERFDKPVADLFDMQDEIVSRLANILNTQLIEAEARRAARWLHPDATDLTFQGLACLNKGTTPEHMTRARDFSNVPGHRSPKCRR